VQEKLAARTGIVFDVDPCDADLVCRSRAGGEADLRAAGCVDVDVLQLPAAGVERFERDRAALDQLQSAR
jgi:hypothetical protein